MIRALLHTSKWRFFIFAFAFLSSFSSVAQYDSVHYIPPFYARSGDAANLGDHFLFLSTNSVAPIDVTVVEADGTPISVVSISVSNEAQINLGTSYAATGVVDQSGINTVLPNEGIICTSSEPFFANIRHSAGSQGTSLTSKGSWAKGTRFRSGHLFTQLSGGGDGPLKTHIISVMAMEDNTTITFSDFKQGVIFNGTPVTGNTSDDITVTLNQFESYIIGAHLDEISATGNDTLVNGVLVESDLPIVMNTGSWCGGSNVPSAAASRDIGLDQIVPTTLLGTEYIIVKRFSFLEEECERVTVIADSDNTDIFLNGSATPTATLNAGEFYIFPAASYDANDIMYLESSAEVYVYQSTNGSATVSHAQGLNFIPPLGCSGIKEVTVPTIDSFNGLPAGIDIIGKVGATILVDGAPIAVAPVPVTGNTDWEVYKLTNMVGTVNFWSDDNINVAMIANSGARGAAGYFSGFSKFEAEIQAFSTSGDSLIVEGCKSGQFILTKPDDQLNQDVVFYLTVSGVAINGVDYTTVPDSLLIPAGIIEDTLFIDPILDGSLEFLEDIVITIVNNNECGDTVTVTDTLYIQDYQYLEITSLAEDQLICTQAGEYADLFVTMTSGVEPYSYQWTPDLGNVPTAQVAPGFIQAYVVAITDACDETVLSDTIWVRNHCLPVTPNVITANGDEINELFVVRNLEQYPGSHLIIMNRWGKVVYENEDYDNSWDAEGLADGVYFYRLTINYEQGVGIPYFDEGNILEGYVHVIR
ncbi:MAG: gliding motility-associated C-terminal domain-containing protein [Crocinitomicaceae bacterium]|nr:gliding motility-associated C-terminal domain-containing protein [Crocinitomicaceae bacterium]